MTKIFKHDEIALGCVIGFVMISITYIGILTITYCPQIFGMSIFISIILLLSLYYLIESETNKGAD